MIYYNSLNSYIKNEFGCKGYKLSLSCSNSCPNRDGKLGTGGCIFCLEGSSAFTPDCAIPIAEQMGMAKKLVSKKGGEKKYIAYFSSFTSTYGNLDKIREYLLYSAKQEDVIAVSVGTRPECLGPEIMEILREVRAIKPLWIELGLQTIHSSTAKLINRSNKLADFDEAIEKLEKEDIKVILHVILGLPKETEEMILETVKYCADKNVFGIKLQLLHILKSTPLATLYEKGEVRIMEMDEYISLLEKCVSILPENMIVHRLTGDGDKKALLAPLWSADKKRVLGEISKKLRPR